MEPQEPENAGRQAVLAGRALADIDSRSVTKPTRRWVLRALQETMQDLDPDARQPHDPPELPPRTRYEAGEVLDELAWLPADLHAWVSCPDCATDEGDLLVLKYPVTNVQYARFVADGGYENSTWWTRRGGTGGQGLTLSIGVKHRCFTRSIGAPHVWDRNVAPTLWSVSHGTKRTRSAAG
jgi:hypothetical protein